MPRSGAATTSARPRFHGCRERQSHHLGTIRSVLQNLVLWANVFALVCGTLTGAALYVSAKLSSNIADVIQQDADKQIGEAQTRGDEARAEAAKANERTAGLEKEAAELRLALERERATHLPMDEVFIRIDGIHGRPIVFYCLADCWMSWNASAVGWGYTNLYWYRDGIDAWEAARVPTADAEPVSGIVTARKPR